LLGAKNVSGNAGRLFRRKGSGESLTVVRPGSAEEIQDVVYICMESATPIYTVRSRYLPGGIGTRRGVILELSRMNRILDVDSRNLKARIEAGVSYGKLIEALASEDLQLLLPVSATSSCVLRSYLDRDVLLGSSGLRSDNLSVFKAVLGNGEMWASGTLQLGQEGRPDFGEDQGPQLSGAFRASEDIFGIPYRGTVYVYPGYGSRESILAGFSGRSEAIEFTVHTARHEHCFQVVAADATFWGALTGSSREECRENSKCFDPWNVAISLEHEDELVSLHREMLKEEVRRRGGRILEGTCSALATGALKRPWYRWDYDDLEGDAHVVGYYCYPRSAGSFYDVVKGRAGESGFESASIAVPVKFGGSLFCETVIFCGKDDFERAALPALESYSELCRLGALVDHPTGRVADIVFGIADQNYLGMINTLKDIWDPAGILNPGALLEGV
jgi:FAD/FMN-containing dehydrogenase